MAWFDQYPDISPLWRVAIVTGFLGALTTFSTFSAEVVTLLHAQRWWSAAWVSAAHLGTCLALTILGCYSMTLGLKWLHRG
jgi:CrcB protein